jgi:hypothetical protein
MSSKVTVKREVPARVQRRVELRASGAAGVHRSRKHAPKGGRQGGRRSAIKEQY